VIAPAFLFPGESAAGLTECAHNRAVDIVTRAEKAVAHAGGISRAKILVEILTEAMIETYVEGRASALVKKAQGTPP
jgi:hypothetical protein